MTDRIFVCGSRLAAKSVAHLGGAYLYRYDYAGAYRKPCADTWGQAFGVTHTAVAFLRQLSTQPLNLSLTCRSCPSSLGTPYTCLARSPAQSSVPSPLPMLPSRRPRSGSEGGRGRAGLA